MNILELITYLSLCAAVIMQSLTIAKMTRQLRAQANVVNGLIGFTRIQTDANSAIARRMDIIETAAGNQ